MLGCGAPWYGRPSLSDWYEVGSLWWGRQKLKGKHKIAGIYWYCGSPSTMHNYVLLCEDCAIKAGLKW